MARSMARQVLTDDERVPAQDNDPKFGRVGGSRACSAEPIAGGLEPSQGSKFDDSWPEEPTSVEAAMTMEELLLEEIRRQGGTPAPAVMPQDGAKKGTHAR